MNKIIEDKKQKSAAQKNGDRSPGTVGSAQPFRKKYKKPGGLFDK